MQTITRFPPSPTGDLHVGGARTALFNWLHAKKTGGQMVLRIEDTDRERSTQQSIDVILDSMKWLGLDWQQGPFYQSERTERYTEVIQQLLQENNAYYCFCSKEKLDATREQQRAEGSKPRYDRHCRDLQQQPKPDGSTPAVIRFKNPLEGKVVFDDVVRGKVAIENAELDDLIIARTDGSPTYNLTVVVDDIDMKISHVIRGDDHINNTPRQINIFHALNAPLPQFAHVPLISGADGQRLSKRHGAVNVLEYRDLGILPEALLNYLVRLGWSHGDQEVFSIKEMIDLFDINQINKSAANFDMEKLLWMNQQYLQQESPKRLARLAKELGARLKKRGIEFEHSDAPELSEVAEAMRSRVQTLEEMVDKSLYFYQDIKEVDPAAAEKHLVPSAFDILNAVYAELEKLKNWEEEDIHQALQRVMESESVKLGKIAQPLRVAISGDVVTPSIDTTVKLIGKKRVLARIKNISLRFRPSR